ncbi:MAG: hypothetical protein ACREFN_08795, partial [Acetobacteraceae bacterium]
MRRSDGTSDRRWVVLGEDGRYGTLGRATDPSEQEVAGVEESLRARGLSGWLAIMSSSPYSHRRPELLMVRPLAAPRGTFD